MAESGSHLILYDGVCGLCHKFNQFILKRDRHDVFRFSSLQSSLARQILNRHGKSTTDLSTVYMVADYKKSSERLLEKASAVLFVLRSLGGLWNAFALLGGGCSSVSSQYYLRSLCPKKIPALWKV